MKRSLFLFPLLLIVGLLPYRPAHAIHETQPAETQIVLPGPNAEKLLEYITKLNPYPRWSLWPGKAKLYTGTEPHGSFLTTYANDAAQSAIRHEQKMEDGAIIVKENYTAEKKFASLTVMYKIKGYNPSAGDWYWAKYDAANKVIASGRAEGCIACHTKKKENDFIFTGPVVK